MATAHFKGPGGSVFAMDLPLSKLMAQKVTKGYLRRVNADGTPYREPVAGDQGDGQAGGDGDGDPPPPPPPPVEEPPAGGAVKAEWVGYAVRAHGFSPDDAEAMTKQDLIDKYGPRPE